MRWKAIKALVKTNIIYATPPNNMSRYRQKQARHPEKKINVTRNIIFTHLFLGLLYVFLFGLPLAFYPLGQAPGIFTNGLATFLLFTFSQGFLSFYNVFYESKDLQSYRPYAFSEAEIMLGKSFSVLLPLLVGLFPITIYTVVLQIHAGHILPVAILLPLLSLGILFAALGLSLLLSVHLLTKTSIFRKYKKIISNLLIALASLTAFGAILLMNLHNTASVAEDGRFVDQQVFFPPLKVFHDFGMEPFASQSLLGIGAWLLVVLVLWRLVQKKVLPEFYEAAVQTSSVVNPARKKRQSSRLTSGQNFSQFVWSYQLNLIGQGSIFVQTVLMPSVLPYIFLLSFMAPYLSRNVNLLESVLSLRYGFSFALIAFAVASINAGGSNLTAIGISLERENYDYLRALPLDMKLYLQLKFKYLLFLQAIFPAFLFLGFCFLIGLPPLLLIVTFLIWALTYLAFSAWGYERDKRLLMTNWTNITELLNRGNRTLKAFLAVLAVLIYMGLVMASFALLSFLSEAVGYALTIITLFLVIGVSLYLTKHYLKKVLVEE